MSTTAEVSARARLSRSKGKRGEQQLARWLRAWYPEACRAVRNTDPDPGDIACTHPEIFWSVKNAVQEEINPWLAELDAKRGTRLGLLVVKRNRHIDPGTWWCWMRAGQWAALTGGRVSVPDALMRIELRAVMPELVAHGYAMEPEMATGEDFLAHYGRPGLTSAGDLS